MKWVNLETQSQTPPTMIDGTTPPLADQLLAAGWRLWDETEPTVPDGMEIVGAAHWEQDPDDRRKAVKRVTLGSVALRLELEATRARAAALPRWILENAFLMVCQQYFGTSEKRGTKELLGKAFALVETDQKAAMAAFGVVIRLDKELVRAAGDLWWDSCEWHEDAEAIAGARQYLGVTP